MDSVPSPKGVPLDINVCPSKTWDEPPISTPLSDIIELDEFIKTLGEPVSFVAHADGLDCFCNPTYKAVCDECDGSPDCWKCKGDGTVEVTRIEAAELNRFGEAVIVIHSDSEEA